MKPRSFKATVDESAEGLRLDQFLARRFGQELDLSRRRIRDLIEDGAVSINGRRTLRLSRTIAQGERIEMRLADTSATSSNRDETAGTRSIAAPMRSNATGMGPSATPHTTTAPVRHPTWELSSALVLFEDDDIIAVNKPPGLPSQATLDTSRPHLYRAVEEYLKAKGGEGYAGLHQRLDRDTSGVIVFTKSRRANAGLARQFAGHTAQKTYIALTRAPRTSPCEGNVFEVKNYLRKRKGKPARMEATSSGGDHAETKFEVIERWPNAWLVRAEPRTGRMHQIRVHLSGVGMPILGDPMYSDRATTQAAPRLMLHAAKLQVHHPVTGVPLCFEAPLPDDFQKTIEKCSENPRTSR